MTLTRSVPFFLVVALASGAASAQASSDKPIAPGLTLVSARKAAEAELRAIVKALPDEARARVVGVYVAFDGDPNDPNAAAACDDDGDYVVVITDAMLSLLDYVAQAKATDDAFSTHKVDDYAAFLAKDQTPGARLLPPPPGFFDASQSRDPQKIARERVRFREALGGVVAHEVAHMTAGDLTCAHPTATRELGDDTWTRAEAKGASDAAAKIYSPQRVLFADATATSLVLTTESVDRDRDRAPEAGYVALLSLFARLPRATYARVHHAAPDASTAAALPSARVQIVHASAAAWNDAHDAHDTRPRDVSGSSATGSSSSTRQSTRQEAKPKTK